MTKDEILKEIWKQNLTVEIYCDLHEEVMSMYREMEDRSAYNKASLKAIKKIAAKLTGEPKQRLTAILALCEEE